jgi:hypothetical protein
LWADFSPNCSIDRTFSVTFKFKEKPLKKQKARRIYRNPIYLAREYQKMIETGKAKNQSDLARKLGISRARANQILKLLKLDEGLLKEIESLGDPLLGQYITERILRNCFNCPKIDIDKLIKNQSAVGNS